MTKQEIHVAEMETQYSTLIKEMVANTKLYDDKSVKLKKIIQKANPNVSLIDSDTTSAIVKYATGKRKVCALNFASFCHAGGGYMKNGHAQEETLCATSCLYNVLSQFPDYYTFNKEHRNDGLYMNRALYTPRVIFKTESMKAKCDILTCAAPNKNAFMDKGGDSAENKKALKSRIKFILNIVREEHPDVVILGAFGAGAFGQNPKVVANYFYEFIDEYIPNDIEVVFAIPNNFNDNYNIFAAEMLKYSKKQS